MTSIISLTNHQLSAHWLIVPTVHYAGNTSQQANPIPAVKKCIWKVIEDPGCLVPGLGCVPGEEGSGCQRGTTLDSAQEGQLLHGSSAHGAMLPWIQCLVTYGNTIVRMVLKCLCPDGGDLPRPNYSWLRWLTLYSYDVLGQQCNFKTH